jgi:hypothetical protein
MKLFHVGGQTDVRREWCPCVRFDQTYGRTGLPSRATAKIQELCWHYRTLRCERRALSVF